MTEINSVSCPWLGLQSYGAIDADRFFGRRAVLAVVDAQLRSSGVSGVVGASGSGKSSLLVAGLASVGWSPVVCRPAPDPIAALAAAESRWRQDPAGESAVLVIDQLEEVFAINDDALRVEFFDRVVALAAGPTPVALGLRSDRYGDCAAYPEFAAILSRGHVLVPAPDDADLAEMIVGPARHAGVEVAPDVVAIAIDDVDGEPGALPLLSHALATTWQRRSSQRIELDDYLASGGVHGSIATAGEAVWSALDPELESPARRILTDLADPTSANLDIGRKLRVVDVALDGDEPARDALDRLVAGRLVVRDGGWIEIAHEAVFREWPRLRAWLEQDQAGLRVLGLVSEQARRWAADGHDPEGLLAGVRLDSGLEISERWPDRISPTSRAYLDASAERRRSADASLVERLRRQRQINRLLRGVIAAAVALAVGVGVFAYLADRERETAESARTVADARRLAALSSSVRGDQLDLAALLAVESNRRSDEISTRGALLASIVTRPELREYVAQGIEAGDATILAGSALVAFGAGEGSVVIVDAAASPATTLASIALGADDVAVRIRFVSDELIAVADDGDRLALYDVRSGDEVVVAVGEEMSRVLSMELSPDGSALAVGDVAGGITVYDARTLDVRTTWSASEAGITALAFHPNGTDLLATTEDPTLSAWRLADGSPIGEPRELLGETAALAFDPSGTHLALGSDPMVEIVDAATLAPTVEPFDAHGGLVYSLQWLDGGAELMSAGEDGAVEVWDPTTGRAVRRSLVGHTASVLAAAVASDEDLMVTSSTDGRVAVWSLAGRGPAARSLPGEAVVTAVAIAGDGTMVTGSDDGSVQRRDAVGEPVGDPVLVGEGRVADVTITPDGETVGVVLRSGAARVYRSGDLRPASPLLAIGERASRGSLSDDGRWFTVSQADRECDPCVHVFDLDSTAPDLGRTMTGSVETERGGVASSGAVLSPDGDRLVTISQAGDVEAFDRSTGDSIWSIDLEVPARSIARSADGELIAVGATSGRLVVLRASDGTELKVLRGHRGRVGSLAFRPDGRELASVSLEDGTMRLWDLDSGLTIGEPIDIGLDDYVQQAWTPDGDRLVVPHRNGTAMEYDLRVERLRAAACSLAGRDLTREEWTQYVGADAPRRSRCS